MDLPPKNLVYFIYALFLFPVVALPGPVVSLFQLICLTVAELIVRNKISPIHLTQFLKLTLQKLGKNNFERTGPTDTYVNQPWVRKVPRSYLL
jgi:hypothetical protein